MVAVLTKAMMTRRKNICMTSVIVQFLSEKQSRLQSKLGTNFMLTKTIYIFRVNCS